MSQNLYTKFFFVALVFSALSGVRAQNPGGVAPAAWYRAGAGVYADAGATAASDNGTVQQWNSQVGSFPLLQATAGWRPVFSNATTLANFNPTLTFTGSRWMRWTAPDGIDMIDRANGSIYAAGYWNSVSNADLAGFGAGTEDFPGLHSYNNKLLFYSFGDFDGVSSNDFVAQHYSTIGAGWENEAGSSSINLAADVSLNGIRAFHNNIANVNTFTGYRDFQVGFANYGSINGQLNEILVYEQRLTSEQMDRVETYLSVKYGSTYANGARNYVNSAGSPVWTATTNAGYHNNIAGIARDDNGALHQKQSWSTNPGQQVLISTTGLANTNAGNSAGLSDGQFLLWGDNGLGKSPSVAVSGLSNITHHFPAIWKVENNGVGTVRVAWPKGLNNLSLIQSDDAAIDGGDAATLMTGNEVTVNGVVYNYADVALANGSYFTFGAFQGSFAPGGVATAAWYRADANVYSDGGTIPAGDAQTVAQWNEFNYRGFDLKQATAANRPVFSNSTALTNFNPTVTFDGNNTWLDYLVADKGDILTRSTGTLFSAGKTTNSSGALFGFGSNLDYPGLYITSNNLTFLGNVGGNWATSTAGIPAVADGNFVGGGGWLNGAGPFGENLIATSLNGNYVSHDALHTWNTNTSVVGDLRVGLDGNYSSYVGQQNEMMVFDTKLTDEQMNRVESYLAIKWGQTLSKAANRDYLDAGGNTVWNGTANEDYYHNVFGLAREDVGAFHQKVSSSVNAGSILTIATDNDFTSPNHDGSRSGFANDRTYFLLGDNANTNTILLTDLPGLERIQRIWLAQRTNSAEALHFGADLSAYGANFDGTKSVYMIIADDGDFTTNVRTVSGTFEADNWMHSYDFDAQPGNQYITYGYNDAPVGSIGCNENQMFHTHGASVTQLVDVDYSGNPITTASMGTASLKYNAAGYNSQDGFIYGISANYRLVRVDATGAAADLGSVTGLPADFEYNSGDFIPGTGMLYVTQNQTSKMYKINVAGKTVDQVIDLSSNAAVSDIAWDVTTAKFYGVNNTTGALTSLDPANGAVSAIGGSGGGVFGAMMGACNGIYGISNSSGFYKFDLTTGARTKLADTPDIPGGSGFDGAHCHSNCVDEEALPVRLLHFNGYQEGSAVTLNWATVSEQYNMGFDVERSADGHSWTRLGFVNGKSETGESSVRLNYSFSDATPQAGRNYYRLKQIDVDGRYEYSRMVVADIRSGRGSLLVYPNPSVNGRLTVRLSESDILSVGVFSVTGIQMQVGKLQSDNTLDVGNLPAGQYFVRVTGKNGDVVTKGFIVK